MMPLLFEGGELSGQIIHLPIQVEEFLEHVQWISENIQYVYTYRLKQKDPTHCGKLLHVYILHSIDVINDGKKNDFREKVRLGKREREGRQKETGS